MIRTVLVFFSLVAGIIGAPAARAMETNLFFEPNRGQAHPSVEFLSRGGDLTAYIRNGEAVLRAGADPVRMRFLGARYTVGKGLDQLPGISSYFSGRNPAGWHTAIPQFRRLRYRQVYDGVDLIYYGAAGRLEYDLVLAPGADASQIRLRYSGVRSVSVSPEGDLLLATRGDPIRQRRPLVYQDYDGRRHEIGGSYLVETGGEVRFQLGPYRHDLPVVIDPVLQYSTCFGGSGYESATSIQVDSAGNVYLAGNVATPDSDANPFVSQNSASRQAALIKFSPSANTILYFVHLGGGATDTVNSLAIDATGAAYLGGITNSSTFPILNAFQPQMKTGAVNPAGFVAKVAPDGKSLIYSSYLGGSNGAFVNSVAVDSSGALFAGGETLSSNFPLVQAAQSSFGSGSQAFLTKVHPSGGSLLFSTFYGGSTFNSAASVALDNSGNAYLAGTTGSNDFPATTGFPAGSKGAGAFAVKFSTGGQMLYATVLGGSGATIVRSGAVDAAGNLYLAGSTMAADFPVANALQPRLAGTSNGFVTKLNPQGNALVYSTYLGGSHQDSLNALAVDSNGDVFAAGTTMSADFPAKNALMGYTGGGATGSDGVVVELAPAGNGLVYSTFLGGNGADVAQSIALTSSGSAYVVGYTDSTNFPKQSPYQPNAGGGGDMFLTILAPNALFTLTSSALQFSWVQGATLPAAQSVSVASANAGSPTPFLATAATTSGGNWLTATASSGTTPAQLSVSVNPAGLDAGSYSGTVRVSTSDGISHSDVAITLKVTPSAPVLSSATPSSITLGSADTLVTVAGSGFQSGCVVSATASNASAVPLSTTFVSASTVRATVTAALLSALGSLTLTATNPGSPESNGLALTVAKPAPIFSSNGIVNAATGQPGAIAPSELITIYRQSPGPSAPAGTQLDASGQVTTQLAGIRVLFDNVAAPLLYASATQINAVTPLALAGQSTTNVQVEYQGTASAPVAMSVSAVAPGIFAVSSSGGGQGAILNEDGSPNSSATPAAPGSIVVFWATGAGVTNPASPDGAVSTGAATVPAQAVTVQIGGLPAEVLYAGAAPGTVSGVLQVNARIPSGAGSGAIPVVLQVGKSASQQGLTVAVRSLP